MFRAIRHFGRPRSPTETGAYVFCRAIDIRAGGHAFEAKVFNIVSLGFADQSLKKKAARDDKAILEIKKG
jgi:aliphatic nitrilase